MKQTINSFSTPLYGDDTYEGTELILGRGHTYGGLLFPIAVKSQYVSIIFEELLQLPFVWIEGRVLRRRLYPSAMLLVEVSGEF